MIQWLKDNASKHIEALVIAGALVFFGRMYLQEHDARLQADTQVKAAQTAIDSIQKQAAALQAVASQKVVVLQKEAATVKTPEEAVQVVTTPERLATVAPPLDVKPEALPGDPGRVSVEALPLYQDFSTCKQCSVELDATKQALDLQKAVDKDKDVQITALKKKPGFGQRMLKGLKVIGCAAGGAAIGGLTKTPQGAAVGAAAGAGLCQAF